MKVRPSARTLLAVAVLLLSIFLCVSSIMELPRTIRNREFNLGNASFHWSAIGAMLLAIVAPIFSVGILFRYRIAAYAFLFCALYWSSWSVFMVWLNDSGFRPGQLIAFPLLLMLAASAIYFIRTSRRKEGEASAGPSPRVLGIGSGIAVLVLSAVFRVTVTEIYLFNRDIGRVYSLRATRDYDGALAILFSLSRRNPAPQSRVALAGPEDTDLRGGRASCLPLLVWTRPKCVTRCSTGAGGVLWGVQEPAKHRTQLCLLRAPLGMKRPGRSAGKRACVGRCPG